jgi:hypothetical protein
MNPAPIFEVTVTTGQQEGGPVERFWPYAWGFTGFQSPCPRDLDLLIDLRSGSFAGIRPRLGSNKTSQVDGDVTENIYLYTHNKEFDFKRGVADTVPAIPFVEAAESILDSIVLYSDRYANGFRIGRYPDTDQSSGKDADGRPIRRSGADVMSDILDGLNSGGDAQLPSGIAGNNGGERKWDIELKTLPSSASDYVAFLDAINDMIRISASVPEFASSSSPDTGTYNLGENIIRLLMANLQAFQDDLGVVINRILKDWTVWNAGSSCPPCVVVFTPVDFDVAKALLIALLKKIETGEPIEESNGVAVVVDWAKVAEDRIPTKTVRLAEDARGIAALVRKQLGAAAGNQEGEGDE